MSVDLTNKSSYEILGVKEYSTNSEITAAYTELKAKYSEDRFLAGEAGNDAAAMLEAVENAYREIMTERKVEGFYNKAEKPADSVASHSSDNNASADYSEADRLIREGKLDEAQRTLDSFGDRLAEWHYLQAVIYYKKNWGNECKKQLEIAMTKDPSNSKYKETYDKLCKEMEYKNKNFTSGTEQGRQPNKDFDPYDRQMGGDDCLGSFCRCFACNMALNCCCNGCCR